MADLIPFKIHVTHLGTMGFCLISLYEQFSCSEHLIKISARCSRILMASCLRDFAS